MPTKKIFTLSLFTLATFVLFNAFMGKPKDPLDKKIFLISVIEVKDGQNGKKSLPDELEFKDGKIFSNVLNDKFGYKWIKYRINKDSAYIDSTEQEIRYFEVEISHNDDADQTMTMMCRIDDYDIDGDIKITKKDKLKKSFVFNGKEKFKKEKKKEK